jgi:hypothetical protein
MSRTHAGLMAGLMAGLLTCAACGAAPINGVIGDTLCLNADPAQDATRLIESVLGAGAIESPSDGAYSPARPHLLQVPADGVVGPHFALLSIEPTDVNLDRVPMSQGGDRSRTEIKLAPSKGGVHEAFKAHEGDTQVYTWRFRIAPGVKFSQNFTHIHQIKANGGPFADAPVITFTPLSNGQMEVRHVADKLAKADHTVLGSAPLAALLGKWIDVREEITYSNTQGHYKLALRELQGAPLLAIDKAGLQMWRSGADHLRPKWGIYRKHDPALNQHAEDIVYFANFGITRGAAPSSDCR